MKLLKWEELRPRLRLYVVVEVDTCSWKRSCEFISPWALAPDAKLITSGIVLSVTSTLSSNPKIGLSHFKFSEDTFPHKTNHLKEGCPNFRVKRCKFFRKTKMSKTLYGSESKFIVFPGPRKLFYIPTICYHVTPKQFVRLSSVANWTRFHACHKSAKKTHQSPIKIIFYERSKYPKCLSHLITEIKSFILSSESIYEHYDFCIRCAASDDFSERFTVIGYYPFRNANWMICTSLCRHRWFSTPKVFTTKIVSLLQTHASTHITFEIWKWTRFFQDWELLSR